MTLPTAGTYPAFQFTTKHQHVEAVEACEERRGIIPSSNSASTMGSSIAIPPGLTGAVGSECLDNRHASHHTGSSSSSSYSSSPYTPGTKEQSPPNASQQRKAPRRGPNLLSPALSKQECTTINIGEDGQPRLISYLSSSQGFMWNPEIFLPSYMDCDYVPLEERREPVHEIVLTDEEIKKMLPQ
ncbi:hypothetical protein VTK73DRAFT_6787 [Phialemonium thermophilum]|uniref:Uncharacterized protein n=1 Tax=Phialemonium thermophilum TaxID=223376 RepID=A0ABR3Y7T3_9PEZI